MTSEVLQQILPKMNRQLPQLFKSVRGTGVTNQCSCYLLNISKSVTPLINNVKNQCLSTVPNFTLPPEGNSWLDRKLTNTRLKFGMTPKPLPYYRLRGLYLFRGVERVNWKEFFTAFEMPDTFHSWFLVIELHMWMLNVRGSDEGREGDLLKRFSIESMWEGAQKRAKKLESYAPSALQEGFELLHEELMAAFLLYDHGLLTSDVALADALWYRFLQEECDKPEKLELLVRHVRKQIHLLDHLSREDFVERANVTWLPISDKT